MEKKLYRDTTNKQVAGVASGLADYFDVDVTWVRLAFVLLFFASGVSLLAYIAMWIVVPARPYYPFDTPRDPFARRPGDPFVTPPPVDVDYRVYDDKTGEPKTYTQPSPLFTETYLREKSRKENNGRLVAGIVLVVLGTLFLFHQIGALPWWFTFHKLWPLVFIIPGIMILLSAGERKYQPFPPSQTGTSTPPATETENPDTH